MTIRIKASRGVYRRCGVVHSTKAVDYPDDEFTLEQLETLKADPVLTVTVLEGDAVAPPGPDRGPLQGDGQGLPTTTPGQDGPPPQNTAGDGSTSANGGPAEGAAPGAPAQQKATRPAKATGSGSKGGANKTAKEGGK
ncbi:HI1506-related protein [Metapseudomonas otitidis]|uniref:HI1506-related protein n=1 Tax=Metapseudomonas otitidis TaxID=319939 RepID=UPI0032163790